MSNDANEPSFRGSKHLRVLSRLGKGGAGEVYEAVDVESNARVAVKTLRDPTPEMLHVLKNEFRAVQDLQHPNLVRLGELLEENGQWFFTMELVGGVDFLAYVSRGALTAGASSGAASKRASEGARIFDERRLRHALRQLVSGLRALHAAGKVHRDVKPENIMVTAEERLVVLDFGVLQDRERRALATGGIVGTPHYMAPEQCICDEVGPAADWYAVGVILYQSLTGRLPFDGSTMELLERKNVETPRPVSEVARDVPEDLASLCMRLLAIEPSDRPDGAELARRLGAPSAAPSPRGDLFVGREAELDEMLGAFERVERGDTETVCVVGESGVGKTALMRRFTERVSDRAADVVVLRGRCHERELLPFKAIDEAMDQLSVFFAQLEPEVARALLPDDVGALCLGFPVMRGVAEALLTHVPAVDVLSPREQRGRLFAAVRALFTRLAERWPVVFTIDDLHWADAESVRLLGDLLRPPGAPRVLLAATLRSETDLQALAKQVIDALSRNVGDVRLLQLGKLPEVHAEELARSLVGAGDGAPASERELRHIVSEAKGHPLFISELVRSRTASRKSDTLARLDDVLWARVMRLDPVSRNFLEAAVIAGVPVAQQIIAEAAGVARETLFALVGDLRGQHLVRTQGVRSTTCVEPYHDRVRESVLAHLRESERVAIHARLAVAAEQIPDADPEFLLQQWEGAGNAKRAAEYALAAAKRAMAALAFERAARLYQRALDDVVAVEARREVQLGLADALTNAGREADAAEVRLTIAADDTSVDANDLRRQAAEQLLVSGRFDRGHALLREVLARVHERYPRSPLAVLFWVLVVRIALRLRGVRFVKRDTHALNKAVLLRIDALWSAGAGFAMTDSVRGAYFQTKNLLLSMRVGDERRAARALAMEVSFQSRGGLKGKARTLALLGEACRLAQNVGTPDAIALADAARGWVYYFLGEWSTSIDAFNRAEATYRDRCAGVAWQLGACRTILYRALAFAGQLDELRRRYPPMLRDAVERNDRFTALNLTLSASIVVGLADDDADAAERRLVEVKEHLAPGVFLVQHYYCMLAETQLALYRGRADLAQACLDAALPRARRSLLLGVASFRAETADIRARVAIALARANPSARERWLDEAERQVGVLQSSGAPWGPAASDLVNACIRAARGDDVGAVEALRAAVATLDRAGLGLYAAAARRRLGQIVGGDEGAALRRAAERYERDERIAAPDAMARLMAPGLERG